MIRLLLLAALAVSCGRSNEWQLVVEDVPPPVDHVTFSPQLTSHGDRVVLSWLQLVDTRYALAFSERTATGWSEPRQIVVGETLVSNAADVPSVQPLADGTLVAHWLQRQGSRPDAYDTPIAVSKDGGASWTPAATPHHDRTPTQHGFTSIFDAPGGGFGLVWLDGRNTDPQLPEGQNGDMALWSALFDSSGKQTAEAAVDSRVCDCCQTSSATANGAVVIAFRDRTPAEVRDIHVTRFDGRTWTAPVAVHDDGWTINGCPVNGPAIAARRDAVAVAWFTGAGNQAQTFVAFSADGGRSFGDRFRVDEGATTGHVDVALLDDGAAVVSWTAMADRRTGLFVRRIERDGTRSDPLRVADVAGTHYPRMAARSDELVFAWTTIVNGYARVRTARAKLTR